VGNEPVTVLDTHAAIWWMADNTKLSAKAKRAIQASISAGDLVMSAASVLEIATLVRRGRLELDRTFDEWLDDVQSLPELRIEPVTAAVAARAGLFEAEVQGDPIDRLIIATAIVLDESLVTADERIQTLGCVRTIW
jgi:PIN domain nuclease of toxin-antitoxin system